MEAPKLFSFKSHKPKHFDVIRKATQITMTPSWHIFRKQAAVCSVSTKLCWTVRKDVLWFTHKPAIGCERRFESHAGTHKHTQTRTHTHTHAHTNPVSLMGDRRPLWWNTSRLQWGTYNKKWWLKLLLAFSVGTLDPDFYCRQQNVPLKINFLCPSLTVSLTVPTSPVFHCVQQRIVLSIEEFSYSIDFPFKGYVLL